MTATRDVARPVRSSLRDRWRLALRRGVSNELRIVILLVALSGVLTGLVAAAPTVMPFTSLMVPLLLGSLLLGPRNLPRFVVFMIAMLVIAVSQQESLATRTVGAVAIQLLMCLIVLVMSFRRSRLGVAGFLGESMFVDLRDRLLGQGGIPVLPAGWHVETALASAGGTPFAGDFFVVTSPTPDRLEVVVVDVSGKGEDAGTRALLLSGAFGGLLGALPPDRFLLAANHYLLSQDWEEGFATAVHLSLDLTSGSFEIRTAGHPPAAHRAAGSGRWSVLTSSGPVLGLMTAAEYTAALGALSPGDAVLLYTDGMVEEPQRDIDLGIDKLLGEAESLLRGRFEGAAQRMVEALGSPHDDRAMVVIHRR